ncbi:hypothetical protein RI054_39g143640 [Pseudoscourfieldia marina]
MVRALREELAKQEMLLANKSLVAMLPDRVRYGDTVQVGELELDPWRFPELWESYWCKRLNDVKKKKGRRDVRVVDVAAKISIAGHRDITEITDGSRRRLGGMRPAR